MSTSINAKKLKRYLGSGDVLEFESDQECLEFFNVYDFQKFKSIEDLKQYQGKYGFTLNGKRYHINTDKALDVYNKD